MRHVAVVESVLMKGAQLIDQSFLGAALDYEYAPRSGQCQKACPGSFIGFLIGSIGIGVLATLLW